MSKFVKLFSLYAVVALIFGILSYKLVVSRHTVQNANNEALVTKANKQVIAHNKKIVSGSRSSLLKELIQETFVGGQSNAVSRRNSFLKQKLLQGADWLVGTTEASWLYSNAGADSNVNDIKTSESNGRFVTTFDYSITTPDANGKTKTSHTTAVIMYGKIVEKQYVVEKLIATQPY